MPITFTKVDLPYGWMGNMSAFPIEYQGKLWPTSEALFQALRFDSKPIRERIRRANGPFAAKLTAKKHAHRMVIEQRGRQDAANMKRVLRLKLDQHPELKEELLATRNEIIIEDSSKRSGESARFWGAKLVDGEWVGQNILGRLWMELRQEIGGITIEDIRQLKGIVERLGVDVVKELVGVVGD